VLKLGQRILRPLGNGAIHLAYDMEGDIIETKRVNDFIKLPPPFSACLILEVSDNDKGGSACL
jgi:hypothetical protein